MSEYTIVVREKAKVVVSSPGPQGPPGPQGQHDAWMSHVLVLDATEPVPSDVPPGTVILRKAAT